MPIDASIYQAFKPADLGAAWQRGQEMGAQDIKMRDLAKLKDDEKLYSDAIKRNMGADGKISKTALSELAHLGMGRQAVELGEQIDKKEAESRKANSDAYAHKVSVVGNAMESLAGMNPQARAAPYSQVRGNLLKNGLINAEDSPEQHDEGWFNQSLNQFRNTKEYMEREKTQAEIAKLKADASRKGTDDPFGRQVALLNYKEEMDRRKKDEEMKKYSNVGGWKLSEGATPTADDAKKFKNGVAASRALLSNLNEYEELVKNKGSEFAGKDAQRMDSLIRDIQLAAKNEDLYGLGVLTGPDLGLLEEVVGTSPTGLVDQFNPMAGSKAVNKAQEFRSLVNSRLNSKAQTYGFDPQEEWKTIAENRKPTKPKETGGSGDAYASPSKPMVRMQAPDGSIRLIPEDQAGEAIAAGGKKVK